MNGVSGKLMFFRSVIPWKMSSAGHAGKFSHKFRFALVEKLSPCQWLANHFVGFFFSEIWGLSKF